MSNTKFMTWAFTLAGCLSIIAGFLGLLARRGGADNIWHVAGDAGMGLAFILFGQLLGRKARSNSAQSANADHP